LGQVTSSKDHEEESVTHKQEEKQFTRKQKKFLQLQNRNILFVERKNPETTNVILIITMIMEKTSLNPTLVNHVCKERMHLKLINTLLLKKSIDI
jgi:hypothetical protein